MFSGPAAAGWALVVKSLTLRPKVGQVKANHAHKKKHDECP
jgi:hypothetical protein